MLFSFPGYEYMASALCTLPSFQQERFTIVRFDNGELHATIGAQVAGERCFILGSIAPPEQAAFSVMLLAHTLKKEGAKEVTAILPYLAYDRQDKVKRGESLATAWIGSLLKSSGVDQVLTIEMHSERDKELFPLPLVSFSPAKLFAATMLEQNLCDATIVAPDEGALKRCEAVKEAAGMPTGQTPYFEKERTDAGIKHSPLKGVVGPRVILFDDILDTGGTLVSASEKLLEKKVKEIHILVIHGLFTGTHWKRLWSLGVKRIFCTDTIPLRPDVEGGNITRLIIAPLLRESLSLFTGEESRVSGSGG